MSPRLFALPWEELGAIAERQGVERTTLWQEERLSDEELAHDPLA